MRSCVYVLSVCIHRVPGRKKNGIEVIHEDITAKNFLKFMKTIKPFFRGLNCVSPKSYAEVLTLYPQDVALFGEQSF